MNFRRSFTICTAGPNHVVAVCLNRLDKELTCLERLTQRQSEVLQLVAEGHTSTGIAKKLDISPRSAETYRSELMKVLDIHDIAGLIVQLRR